MSCFQVLEENEGIEEAILRGLSPWRIEQIPHGGEDHPALMVVSPRAAARGTAPGGACRTVLLPGEAGGLLSKLQAACAVSYGPSPRDTLTISSRERDRLWCALQREVVTVEGHVVERQEFPVALRPGRDSMGALAAAGALLLLGVPPEALGSTQ